jgi:3-hydroxymyristoyl/3-hydroxydecanoyl-(acyl carrier protein) dehydratase
MATGRSGLEPEIRALRASATGVELDLRVPESLAVWPGHFPDYFVVPGVLQLDWILRIAARELGVGRLLRADFLKFRTPMRPGQHCTLSIELAKDGCELGFRIAERDVVFATGKLTVEPRVP